ncbi:hypothetical protein BKA70DRAFT_1242623 [Coprinopsis sp. MPI-PUGE-AT-0042]|nr:hypothetical protein BKA70DRAFT_1242623 [Coprinopsis sp. MPI-PUGE-AT-0042]
MQPRIVTSILLAAVAAVNAIPVLPLDHTNPVPGLVEDGDLTGVAPNGLLSEGRAQSINEGPVATKGCGKGLPAKLHSVAHCVFFFIPQPFSHPEDKHQFSQCCRPWSSKVKEITEA